MKQANFFGVVECENKGGGQMIMATGPGQVGAEGSASDLARAPQVVATTKEERLHSFKLYTK